MDDRSPLEPVPGWLRAWGCAEAGVAVLLLGVCGPMTAVVLALSTSSHDLASLAEAGYPVLMSLGAATGALVGAVASWRGRRVVIWWAPAAVLGAAVGATVAAGVVAASTVGLVLALSATARAPYCRGRRLLVEGRARRVTRWVVPVLSVGGCVLVAVATLEAGRPTETYRLLQADPMAAEDLPGLEVVHDWSHDEDLLGTSPEVERLWRIVDGAPRPAKLRELAATARGAGWRAQPDELFCEHTRSSAGVVLCLELRPGTAPDQVVVRVSARFLHATPDGTD